MSLDVLHSTMGIVFLAVWFIVAQIMLGERDTRLHRGIEQTAEKHAPPTIGPRS